MSKRLGKKKSYAGTRSKWIEDPKGTFSLPGPIHSRLKTLALHWRKDGKGVSLHTYDTDTDLIDPSFASLLALAVEWFCDIHSPILTTPANRSADYEPIKCQYCNRVLHQRPKPGLEPIGTPVTTETEWQARRRHQTTRFKSMPLSEAIMACVREGGPLGRTVGDIRAQITKGGYPTDSHTDFDNALTVYINRLKRLGRLHPHPRTKGKWVDWTEEKE